MNFEKLEIYGFKSFADKVEIKFNDGITGIVGPNGCGKSNVSDAIRWVLGEQSAKRMRGSSMQDVIFSGTQNRKSLSYCEVSLFFNNTNKIFDVEYTEVIITRKLYRSGESEYFINKKPARLKDIVALLHQCGIAAEGYTIIGQGRVNEIITAKPEDRRAIFEEATGIAHFKTKKVESERKLDRTHDNIVRYSDIILEIENQLGPLERQAEKAKEFNALSEELKHHEINTYISKTEGVATEKGKINVKIDGIVDESNEKERRLKKARDEYDKMDVAIAKADEDLRSLNDELTEKRVSMEKSSGAQQLYGQKISTIEAQIERAEMEIKQNKALAEACEAGIAKDEKELELAKKSIKEKQKLLSEKTKELTTLREKIILSEELASANTKKVIESIESLSDVRVNKGTMSIEKQNLLERRDDLVEKINALALKRDGLFNDKEDADQKIVEIDRSIFEEKNKIVECENAVRCGNEEVAKVDNQIYSLNSIIASLSTKLKFYQDLKDNHENFMPVVKTLLNSAKTNAELNKRIKGVVAEIITNDRKYDVALETALKAAAQNIVTKNPDDAKYLIQYLKANGIGRATFLPIDSVRTRERLSSVTSALKETGALGVADEIVKYDKEFYPIISSLLGNTLIVDNLDNATQIAKKYSFGFKIVTLDGDEFSPQGAMTGGVKKNNTAGVLSSDRKIEETAGLLKQNQAKMDELQTMKKELEEKRDKALDELEIKNDNYSRLRQDILLLKEKLSSVEAQLSEVEREMESLREQMELIEERLLAVDERYKKVDLGGEKLEADKTSIEANASRVQGEIDELKKKRDILESENTALQVEITELSARVTSLEEDITRLTKAMADAKEAVVKLERSNADGKILIEELRREQEKVALSKEDQDYINSIRAKIDDIENYKLNLRRKQAENNELKNTLTEEIAALGEKKHNLEIALAKIDSDLEYMEKSIWEDYQETYETALKYKVDNYDASEGEKEIVRIRRKRNSLGTINGSAIEDAKALRERYDEMIVQRDDLLKAESDLKEAIEKIKAEMLSQFDAGFGKINENFQKIFKELFGGGRAMLQLDYTNVEDRLEAGVEIVAEPPGKKLQKLSLLSGGEMALTTIAILFAILKLRPMPFCVLDEIEAALDDANVARFADYLRKFSTETQFIVITHKKPTMERSDSLFGVTMQEKGVSKIVSVKLSDIEDIEDITKKGF